MSRSGALRSPIELVTVGDFDPGAEQAIEHDFIGRVMADLRGGLGLLDHAGAPLVGAAGHVWRFRRGFGAS